MLTDEEKRELLEMAASPELREEFRRLQEFSRFSPLDLDQLLRFLTAFGRFGPPPPPREPGPPYSKVLL